DRLQDRQGFFIRAPMQWPLECADGRRYCRIHIRERRGSDARGKRRGVELMIRIEDEHGIEDFHLPRLRWHAIEREEKLAGMREVVGNSAGIFAVLNAPAVRD